MIESKKTYYPKVDRLRIVACLAVIVIHVTATPVITLRPMSIQQLVFIFANRIAKPSVPVFIFISGFLAYQPAKPFQPARYVKKIKHLVVPYALWTLLYMLVFVKTAGYPLSPQFYLKHLILGDMVYHLYFMIILIQLTIFSPLLIKGARQFGVVPFWLASLFLQLLVGFLTIPYSDRLFISYIAYYLFGFAMHHLNQYKRFSAVAVLLLGLIYTGTFIGAIDFGISMPQWGAASLYTFYSLAACAFLFYWLPNHPLSSTAHQFALATEHIYYAHPLAIMAGGYISIKLAYYSIIGQSLLATALIFLTVIPASMWYIRYKHFTKY
ncbi:acyltransferase [Fusibacter paucivorans]|uniref:Acyltransferase n=1 Tax=Fusibacter paucivorans TaxID=76009 RepID=A0ABS5PR94_9FIRM|nr:acyltransferase [Fusibacter paucivorans]MBS7527591.1 acyltransferase [Fusibacter paucivorans]